MILGLICNWSTEDLYVHLTQYMRYVICPLFEADNLDLHGSCETDGNMRDHSEPA